MTTILASSPFVTEVGIDCRRKALEGINNRQNPNLATSGQLVMNEVHCPDMVGMGRLRAVNTQLRLDTALGNLVGELGVHLLVKTIDSRRIDRPSITREQDMNATINIAPPRLADVLDL